MASNMAKRVSVALVGIPFALGVVYLGGWYLAATVALLGWVGATEYYDIARQKGSNPFGPAGAGVSALFPVFCLLLVQGHLPYWTLPALGVGLILATSSLALRSRTSEQSPLADSAITIWGAVYTGGLSSALIILRELPEAPTQIASMWLVIFPMAMVWICDSAAMEVGKRVKGPKFAPTISPNKTWSGTIAGAVASMAAALIYGRFILEAVDVALPVAVLLSVGALAAILGQLGDLTESLFKREAGVKDSGNFFPGHGGVLDRLDSMYWVLPSAAIVFAAFGIL